MTYEVGEAGRVDSLPSADGRDGFWTFDAVEQRLIEAMRLWWRSPGASRWPFAGDGPWHLLTRLVRAGSAQDVWRIEQDEWATIDARRVPLGVEDIARRDEASEWLAWIGDASRPVVAAALVQLAAKRAVPAGDLNDGRRQHQIDWRKVRALVAADIGSKGLYRRYTRAITGVVQRLNRDGVR